MNKKSLQIIGFFSVKTYSIILFYFLYQFIKQSYSAYVYTFVSFYSIERLLKYRIDLFDFYRYFISNHIDVLANTNLDQNNPELCSFKNYIPIQIKAQISQIKAFEKFIMNQMIINHLQIIYDLFVN
ncbi:hypothetical protein ABPG74_015877 [Tetrahymena malaccensis]